MVLTQQLAVDRHFSPAAAHIYSFVCNCPRAICSSFRAVLWCLFSTALVFIGSEQALLPPDQKPLGSCGHINQLWPRSVPLIGSAAGLQREGFPPQSMCLHAASPVPACVCKCQWNHGVSACVCVCVVGGTMIMIYFCCVDLICVGCDLSISVLCLAAAADSERQQRREWWV